MEGIILIREIYENELNQKNPLEGHKVIFVKNEKDVENADGV